MNFSNKLNLIEIFKEINEELVLYEKKSTRSDNQFTKKYLETFLFTVDAWGL